MSERVDIKKIKKEKKKQANKAKKKKSEYSSFASLLLNRSIDLGVIDFYLTGKSSLGADLIDSKNYIQ